MDVGVDPGGVAALVDALASDHQEVHALLVARRGQVVAETYWEPYRAEHPVLLHSLSKAFTSAAVGIAVADGAFGYDDLLVDLFADAVDASRVGPRARTIRVRDCLAMATGHETDPVLPLSVMGRPGRQPFAEFLAVEPTGEPGTTFCYNQWATYTLAEIVRHATGRDVLTLLAERLFGPLGITDAVWRTDQRGRVLGFSGLHLTPEALLSFFQLLSDDGVRDGVRLLPEEWVREHRRVHVVQGEGWSPDWSRGYGWQFWAQAHGYRGDGAYGQFGLVLPGGVVVVLTGATERMQAVLDRVWEHLVPAIDRPATLDQAALDARLAHRQLEPVRGERGAFVRLGFENRHNRWRLVDDAEGWSLRWMDADGGDNEIGVGHDRWRPGVMTWRGRRLDVATSGAWVGWGHFVAQVVALSGPFWILVHLRDDGSGWTEWNLQPLHGSTLADQALPLGSRPRLG